MNETEHLVSQAKETLLLEADAIRSMAERLDSRFVQAVTILEACKGRVVVTGMGKSGIVGMKIAATLSSTGTPAFFLHPAEGSHGDLGMVTQRDVVLAISNSGETAEVLTLLPALKFLGVAIISLVGRELSTLARVSTVALDVAVAKEACPLGLAPTCSTTVALAMGDALAVALLQRRQLSPEQYALFHPGGALGKKLLLRVADLMHTGSQIPLVHSTDPMRQAILEMTAKRLGVTGVLNEQGALIGIITDGDLRRWLERDSQQQGSNDLQSRTSAEVMTRNPKTIPTQALAIEALRLMEENKITTLFVGQAASAPEGILHLHDILGAGLL
ncbi:KpsF/GutQ family sugar-phosphate isomerase [Candidatus Magnetaquicoccus inordinatus]|uniref:KpsF/GutQ family sugar-phosphate isomerase n=1 Tax=Candidatus Magnetaquicoccus inordinatus TaxID=2496818 RepID=UPI00102C2EFA|nr:KpsF/GutQ family sugar-phosphate isomerase [Candidatus Magnetaquicoccus inordinatus]